MMSHEKLDVYQASIEFFGVATTINGQVARGNSELQDQLKRASMSIPLNIAEAVGKNSKQDMPRFLAIARGSTLECAAIIDVSLTLGIIDKATAVKAKALLERIVAMLTKMILSPAMGTTHTATSGRAGPSSRGTST
jgi:four helix bundle protein